VTTRRLYPYQCHIAAVRAPPPLLPARRIQGHRGYQGHRGHRGHPGTRDTGAFSPDGHTLASGSGDGARLWNLSVQYATDRICSTAGGLTAQQWTEYIPQLRYQPSCPH